MKCPWQKEVIYKRKQEEVTRNSYTIETTMFGDCATTECPFYKSIDRCMRAEAIFKGKKEK